MKYLSAQALKGLKQYEYKSGGYTWLDDVHQPFWNGVTELLPRWLAPNLITLTGLGFLFAAYLLTIAYMPDFGGDAPRWVYFCSGAAALIYLHLDCIDGKQARRTKSSSPLGQLFDHGCDAFSVHLILAAIACSLNLGPNWRAVAGSMIIMTPWALAHWEEYHNGTMLYGNGVWGLTEANYALVILHFVTAVAGPGLWTAKVGDSIPLLRRLPYALKVNDSLLLLVLVAGCEQVSGQIWRTLTGNSVKLGAKDKGHKALGRDAAAWQLTQLLGCLFIGVGVMLSSIRVGLRVHRRAVAASFGIIYAHQSTVLIMAHMTKQPFSIAYWPQAVLLAVAANDFGDVVPGVAGLQGKTVVALCGLCIISAGYLHYVFTCVGQITHALGIKCLTISHYKADPATRDAQPSPTHSPGGTSMRLRSHDKASSRRST